MKIDCPWCNQVIEEGETEAGFEFKLVPSWNHPGACCNLCDSEILEACELEERGDEEYYLD